MVVVEHLSSRKVAMKKSYFAFLMKMIHRVQGQYSTVPREKSLDPTNVKTMNCKAQALTGILDLMELMVKMSTIHLSGITLQNLVIITNEPVLPTTKEPHLP